MSQSVPDHDLEEKFFITNSAQMLRWLPWLRMFRAFRIAIGVKCMLLALLASFLLPLGDEAIRSTLGSNHQQLAESTKLKPLIATPLTEKLSQEMHGDIDVISEKFENPFTANLKSPSLLFVAQLEAGHVLMPLSNTVLRTWLMVFSSNLQQWMSSATHLLWALIVYAIFGGAISRITAHEITGKGNVGLLGALKFSGRRAFSYLSSPMLTLVGIGGCWLALVGGGLLGRIPVAGEFLLGLFWIVAIIIGFFLALILIGVTLSWPLMFTTISVEASDAFDGLSRAFSYIFNRPWYALFLVFIMSVYGVILAHFVTYVQQLSIRITDQVVGVGLGDHKLHNDALYLIGCWMRFVDMIPFAFYISFFWVSTTIIYFLLRYREDGTPFFVMGEDKLITTALPLSGIPAAELREAQLDM